MKMYLPTSVYTNTRGNPQNENNITNISSVSTSPNRAINRDINYNRTGLPHTLSPVPPLNTRPSPIVDLKPPASILLPHLNDEVRHYSSESNINIFNQYHYQNQHNSHLQPYHSIQRHHDILNPNTTTNVNEHHYQVQQIPSMTTVTTNIPNSPPSTNILQPSIESTKAATQVPLHYHLHKTVNDTSESSTQSTPHNQHQTLKKKRGRPKKLILDPSTNEYIDSSHPNYKHLNKTLKESMPHPNNTNLHIKTHSSDNDSALSKLYDKPTCMRTLQDDAVQELLLKKDKRGRPRKFPIEQTGLTIKGIRVNGVSKHKRKSSKS